MRTLARVTTTLEVQRGQQRHPKRQPVKVDIAACPVRLTYSTGVRRKEPGENVTKELWLVQVQVLGTTHAPWWLLTDWPVGDEQSAVRIFTMYRERWQQRIVSKSRKSAWAGKRCRCSIGGPCRP